MPHGPSAPVVLRCRLFMRLMRHLAALLNQTPTFARDGAAWPGPSCVIDRGGRQVSSSNERGGIEYRHRAEPFEVARIEGQNVSDAVSVCHGDKARVEDLDPLHAMG